MGVGQFQGSVVLREEILRRRTYPIVGTSGVLESLTLDKVTLKMPIRHTQLTNLKSEYKSEVLGLNRKQDYNKK